MNLKKIIKGAAKSFSGFKGYTKKTYSRFEAFKAAPGLRRAVDYNFNIPQFNIGKFASNAYKAAKVGGAFTGAITGAAVGGYVGGVPGALGGAAIGGLTGFGGLPAARKIGAFAFKHPKTTFTAGILGTSAYSFGKPFVAKQLVNQKMNRPTNPAIHSGNKIGPGYVTLGSKPRIRMSGNNNGASGDLTLSLHKLRHGR